MEGANEWKVSLHGGHSGEFCDHAEATLREMLQAAVAAGYHIFGVSEHAPRSEARFLYREERRRGWDVAKITEDFQGYILAVNALAREFADRLIVLRGFEAEVVPTLTYADRMRQFRDRKLPDGSAAFDYLVGSVHYVDEISIDGEAEHYAQAVAQCGGVEALAIRYYAIVADMVEALQPEVVGHLDLIKKNAHTIGWAPPAFASARIRAAAQGALEAIRAHQAILDLNTAGWRKGLGEPYPAPWLVRAAHAMNIPFCFGDDSHRPSDVGAGLAEARQYLRDCGVPTITMLTREGAAGCVVRREVAL